MKGSPMNIEYITSLQNQITIQAVWELVKRYDHEFIPPLSARESTSQSILTTQHGIEAEPVQYFEQLLKQEFLIALEKDKLLGFMSFNKHYVNDDLQDQLDTIYISTIIVDGDYRGKGITTRFYAALQELAKQWQKPITTRTWSTNHSHIHLLNKLQFKEIKRIKNGRGTGVDTVYYRKWLQGV